MAARRPAALALSLAETEQVEPLAPTRQPREQEPIQLPGHILGTTVRRQGEPSHRMGTAYLTSCEPPRLADHTHPCRVYRVAYRAARV
jgi:hypothetical protein